MFNPSDEKDQALLTALAQQAIRVPVPMFFVVFVISGLAWDKAPVTYILTWAFMAISMQVIRFIVIRKLPEHNNSSTTNRLRIASLLSLANGLILASSIIFFEYFDDTSRAVHSMIMIGIVAGTIATSYGYRPVFIGLILPILSSISFAWLILSGDSLSTLQTIAIAILMASLGGVLYASSRDVYKSFGESFAIRQELEEALESERSANAAKTRFLAAASHDLRQPLHTMSMLSAALTLRDLDEKSKTIASKMNIAMGDLSSELDSLLDISKLDAGVMQVHTTQFQLSELLDRVTSNYTELANRKNLELTNSADNSIYLETDKTLLERVIRNLLDNAIKYTDAGDISVVANKHNRFCTITISDTGIGIPKHEQHRVREEFYQLNNHERDRQKGLGLGLSIVWRLIPLLEATLSMHSEVSVGTRYELRIPIANTIPINSGNSKSGLVDINNLIDKLKGVRVLIVEDNKEVRKSTRTVLEYIGLIVFEANGSQSAIQLAKLETIDIALVDLRLPNGDSGFVTINRLHELNQDLPIIILSGETSPDILQTSTNAGCVFLVKPVEMRDLITEICRSLNKPTGKNA